MWVVVFLCIALGYEKLLSRFPKSVTIQWRRHFCFQQNNGRGDKSRESRFLQLSFGMMSMTDTIIQVGCLDIFLQNKSKGEKSGRHYLFSFSSDCHLLLAPAYFLTEIFTFSKSMHHHFHIGFLCPMTVFCNSGFWNSGLGSPASLFIHERHDMRGHHTSLFG